MLPVMPESGKMIFLGYYTPVRKVILQDSDILKATQKKLDCLL